MAPTKSVLDDSSERLRMLQAIWAWLPAFRIVAETEHLPTASRRLGISASALSRTIRMIEQELGEELFSRSGRNIALNDAGAKLLGAVRDAMRRVHQGIHSLELDEIIGNTRIAADRLMSSSYVLSALTELRASHPRLHATVVPLEGCDGARELLEGRLDLWLAREPLREADIAHTRLGFETRGIYCGRRHPFFSRADLRLENILSQEFICEPPDESGHPTDGWPLDLERQISMHIADPVAIRDACLDGQALAVLPDACALRFRSELRRLPVELRLVTPMVASHRPRIGPPGRTEAVLQTVAGIFSRIQNEARMHLDASQFPYPPT